MGDIERFFELFTTGNLIENFMFSLAHECTKRVAMNDLALEKRIPC